jgi:hypothetical protein
VFDKTERWFFPGDMQPVLASAMSSVASSGFALQPFGPNSWAGRGNAASWGLLPMVALSVIPAQTGAFLEIRQSAEVDTNGVILIAVFALFFFPVALILGVLAYQDLQNRQTRLLQAIWAPISGASGQPR